MGSKIVPRELCKQEASTFGVRSLRSGVPQAFTHEWHEEIWNERKASTSLHWTISHPWEVWERGVQVGTATVVGRNS
jgi:hypothetical protein